MAFDWKALLGKVAPFIGAAATGNVPALVTMAATAIGSALGKDVKPTQDGIAEAMAGASADDLLKLKEAEQDFALKMQALGFDHVEHLEQLAVGDRDSARVREEKVQDWTPRILAYLIITASIALGIMVISGQVDAKDTTAATLVGTVIGYVFSEAKQVLAYYFGSSAGSDKKTDLLAQAQGGSDG